MEMWAFLGPTGLGSLRQAGSLEATVFGNKRYPREEGLPGHRRREIAGWQKRGPDYRASYTAHRLSIR